ncbi:hypothetical protein Tco_0129295 [Tanacetum coccineum]
MDDPNITMEEYIRLEEEKARRRGKVYNWETATYELRINALALSDRHPTYHKTPSDQSRATPYIISYFNLIRTEESVGSHPHDDSLCVIPAINPVIPEGSYCSSYLIVSLEGRISLPPPPRYAIGLPICVSDDSEADGESEPADEAFRRWRSAPLSTPYPPTTSESSLGLSSERSLDSSSLSSGPSRKRCRSPTASVPSPTHDSRSIAPTPADLLPPRKRFRDSYSPEDSGEEHMEVDTADAEAVADVGISDGVVAHTEDGVGMRVEIIASDVREDDEEFETELFHYMSEKKRMLAYEVTVPPMLLEAKNKARMAVTAVMEMVRMEMVEIEIQTRMVEGYAVKNAENKIRLEVNQKDNCGQQPPFKRPNVGGQNVARAYTANNNERKPYNGVFLLPLCNKCKLHHEGPCTVRCGKCNKVGHLTRNVRQGYFRSDCPKLKDQNRGNKAGNKNGVGEERGKAYVLGADRSFVSTTFSTLLDVTPDTLDVSYAVCGKLEGGLNSLPLFNLSF